MISGVRHKILRFLIEKKRWVSKGEIMEQFPPFTVGSLSYDRRLRELVNMYDWTQDQNWVIEVRNIRNTITNEFRAVRSSRFNFKKARKAAKKAAQMRALKNRIRPKDCKPKRKKQAKTLRKTKKLGRVSTNKSTRKLRRRTKHCHGCKHRDLLPNKQPCKKCISLGGGVASMRMWVKRTLRQMHAKHRKTRR